MSPPGSSFSPANTFRASPRFINSVAYLPPSPEAPQGENATHRCASFSPQVYSGYVVTGGHDSVINIWPIEHSREEPLYTLLGHSDNVCALHVGGDGTIISGSWDRCVTTSHPLSSSKPRLSSQTRRSAKVWTRFQLVHDLVGHNQSVWAVVAMEGDEYLTGALSRAIT